MLRTIFHAQKKIIIPNMKYMNWGRRLEKLNVAIIAVYVNQEKINSPVLKLSWSPTRFTSKFEVEFFEQPGLCVYVFVCVCVLLYFVRVAAISLDRLSYYQLFPRWIQHKIFRFAPSSLSDCKDQHFWRTEQPWQTYDWLSLLYNFAIVPRSTLSLWIRSTNMIIVASGYRVMKLKCCFISLKQIKIGKC